MSIQVVSIFCQSSIRFPKEKLTLPHTHTSDTNDSEEVIGSSLARPPVIDSAADALQTDAPFLHSSLFFLASLGISLPVQALVAPRQNFSTKWAVSPAAFPPPPNSSRNSEVRSALKVFTMALHTFENRESYWINA